MAKQQQAETRTKSRNKPQVEVATLAEPFSAPSGLFTGLLLAAGDGSVDRQAALLADTRLQVVQRQALASQISQIQGNHHFQQVATSIVQRTCSPGHEGSPRPIARWRFARQGEHYHSFKTGWREPPAGQESDSRPTAASLEAPIASNDFFSTQINNLMESGPIMRMRRQFNSLQIIFHLTRRIFNVEDSRIYERRTTLGQTLKGHNSVRPANEIHIAIRASLTLSDLDETASHELLHAFMAAPAPPARTTRSRRRRSEGQEASLHPRELENALRDPQSGLAARMAWSPDWNHEYRFGWFIHPAAQAWYHLDNAVLRLGGPLDLARCAREAGEQAARLSANTEQYQELQSKYNLLIRIKRERLYEPGFRVTERPEEDAATFFGKYFSEPRELMLEYPKRFSLMHIFFNQRR